MSSNKSLGLKGKTISFDDILRKIVYTCRENNSPIAESLIAYIMKISYNDKTKDFYFSSSNSISEDESIALHNSIISLLKSQKDGVLETLMLQIKFDLSSIEEESKAKSFKQFFENEINSILDEIKKFIPNTKKDFDSINIYKKIFNFLLIKTKEHTQESFDSEPEFEEQTNNLIEKEIYSAFDNVLPKSGLPPFIALSSNDKVTQLNELSNIIFGIRLLNKELGKGGVGLMSLEDIKRKNDNKIFEEINERHNVLSDICQKYTEIYEVIDFGIIVEDEEIKTLEKIRKFIIFYHQLGIFFTLLKNDISVCFNTIENLSFNYAKEIQYLLNLVEKKSALSKEQVYPRFESLSHIYSKFQEQFFILSIRKNVYKHLINFLESSSIPSKEFDIKELGPFVKYLQVALNKKPQNTNVNIEAGTYQNGVSIILPSSRADFMDLKLEYQGFCIVTLIKKEGLLVTGQPNIVAKYKDRYLVFYNDSSIQDFLYDPDKFIIEINNYLKKNSYLINLLNATDDFPNANLNNLFKSEDSAKYKSSSLTVDAITQTVDHPQLEAIPKELIGKIKFDRDYIWNEWELKIKALQLADIINKETKSCQTNLSHFRKEKETQIYQKSDTGVNTMISKGTNLSIQRNYVTGLREYDNSHWNNN